MSDGNVVRLGQKIELHDPPSGKVQTKVEGVSSFIEWAPGNGLVYRAIVSDISGFRDNIGASKLLSIECRSLRGYVSCPVNPSGIYHMSYLEEKFGKYIEEEELHYYTALLNWIFFDSEVSRSYAKEIYDEARARWK